LSVDPDVAETGQPYAFAEGDPLNEADPTGDGAFGPPGTPSAGCNGLKITDCSASGSVPQPAPAPTSGYYDQKTPTVVVATVGDFQTTVSADVQISGTGTKPVAGITSDGTVETEVGPLTLTFAPGEVTQAELNIHSCSVPIKDGDLTWSCTRSYTGDVGPVTVVTSITVTLEVRPSALNEARTQREMEVVPEVAGAGATIVGGLAQGAVQIVTSCLPGSPTEAYCFAK
jgi:hypothetical protein